MGTFRRPSFVIAMALVLCVVFALAAPVFAEEGEATEPATTSDTASPDGVYAVVGTTNTGKQVSTNVLVTSAGDRIQFQAKVMGIPITTSGPANWNADRTEVTVPISVYVFGLAEGSGSITLIATDGGWDFFAAGDGKVLSKRGSATAEGFMPVGAPPTPELVTDATGVSGAAQSLDDATGALQSADAVTSIESQDVANEAAAMFLALLFIVMLEVILGVVLL